METTITIGAKSRIDSVAYIYPDRDPIRHVALTDEDGGTVTLRFYRYFPAESAGDVQRLIDALTDLRDGVAGLDAGRRGDTIEETAFPALAEAVA